MGIFGKKGEKAAKDKVETKSQPLQYQPGNVGNGELVMIKLLEAINKNLMSVVSLLNDIKKNTTTAVKK